ncbi:carboxymuconolactone decarboxylase family protein [Mucilaginibacter gynuensis]
MSERFKIVDYQSASPEVKAIYEETMKEMGIPFVLNWFKCQGNNATVLRGNWEKLRNTMLRGKVPFVLKQLIIYNISNLKGCDYCSQAHGIIADSLGKSLTGTDDIKLTADLNSTYIPSSYRKAIEVVTKCALAPRNTTDADFESLRDEGYSLEEVQELMALADLTNMINTIADISGIQIDNELVEPR